MKLEIKSSYDQQLKDLVKAFNRGLITFGEMCILNLNNVDKEKIDMLRNKQVEIDFVYLSIIKNDKKYDENLGDFIYRLWNSKIGIS